MMQDKFSTMVKDGKDLTKIIQSVPEDKRVLVSAVAEAFLNGLTAGESWRRRSGTARELWQSQTGRRWTICLRG